MRRTFPLDHRMPALHLTFFVQTLGPLVLSLACLPIAGQAHAQAPITQSGLNTQVSPPIAIGTQTQYNITGGTRPGGGTNLFHSFGNFNVPTNNIANFLNETALPTNNILGRVTGGNLSSIYGTIQTTGFGNANLFLMNPAGFLFGPNATVNVGGMVAFTSADYLRLTDGVRFNATPNATADALLTPSPVAAFGFLGSNPGAITVQGSQFSVTDGQSISLVGGDITIQSGTLDDGTVQSAKLSAPGGQINLASVASPGEVSAVDFMPTSGMTMGNISLSQDTLLDVSADAAGTVRIRGGQLVMDHATISADTVNANGAPVAIDINLAGDMSISAIDVPALTARTSGSGDAGEIRIVSKNLTAQISPTDPSFALIDTHTSETGRAGKVTIDTGILDARTNNSGYLIDAGTGAEGNGNDVTITAKSVALNDMNINTGDFRAIFSTPQNFNATGSGGNIYITADRINTDFAVLVTQAFQGQAGDITLTAHDIALNTSLMGAMGLFGSGAVTVKSNRFTMTNGTQIETETAFAPGRDVAITTDVLEMTNGSIIRTQTSGPEPAGNILVTATDQITLSDSPFSSRPSGFYSNSYGVPDVPLDTLGGNAGSIVLTTPSLTMLGGARIDTTTQTSGRGGDVTINTTGPVSISGELKFPPLEDVFTLGSTTAGGIFTRTIGGEFCTGACGNAGNITITARSLAVGNGSLIDSGTSSTGRGGDITIHATNTLSLSGTLNDGAPAGIFSRAFGINPQSGSGGNISLTAGQSVTISDSASVSASTSGSGNAGNIQISSPSLVATNGAQITSRSAVGDSGELPTGNAGNVTIQGLTGQAETVLISGLDDNFNSSGIFTDTQGSGAGGSITVNANTVTLHDWGMLSAATSSTGNAGNINIAADTLALDGFTQILANTGFGSEGRGGNIDVQVRSASLTGGSGILTNTAGLGDAGNIRIQAAQSMTLMDNASIASSAFDFGNGAGNAGLIHLTAPTIEIQGGTIVSLSQGPGNAGNIILEANTFTAGSGSTISSETLGPGRGGDISIRGLGGLGSRAGDVTISGGTAITSTTSGDGRAGDIAVTTERIALIDSVMGARSAGSGDGGTIVMDASESVQISIGRIESNSDVGPGHAGQITITTPTLTVDQGGVISTSTGGTGNAGSITVNANLLHLFSGGQLTSSSAIPFPDAPAPSGSAGTVTVQGLASPAQSVLIDGFGSGIFTDTQGTGAGGNIFVNANSVTLQNGGSISASTFGTEPTATGGTITIDAESLRLDAGNISAGAFGDNTGRAGDVVIAARTIDAANFSFINTFSTGIGQAGDITLTATDAITLTDSFVNSDAASLSSTEAGNGGFIHLHAPTIDLRSSLVSTTTLGAGNAGNTLLEAQQLTLSASESGLFNRTGTNISTLTQGSGQAGSITIRGLDGPGSRAQDVAISGASTLLSRTSSTGNAGAIGIDTVRLAVTDGSQINTETNSGTGAGGNIFINANSVTLQNGGALSAATSGIAPSAIGGTITVNAANTVTMTGGGTMTANSSGAADAGSINITALNGLSMQNSAITTQVTPSAGSSAGGGNIKITTSPEATVLLQNSTISASVADGPGGGGNISIDPQFVILQNSQILAQAAQGQGGAITIVAGLFLPDATSVVNADSGSGLNGNITIQSPNSPASGKIIPLSDRPLIAAALLSQRCAALAGGNFSSFTLAGRESLPAEPGSWLSSPLALALTESGGDTLTEANLRTSRNTVAEGTPLSLRHIAPAGFLTQAFAVDGWAGCTS